MTKENTALILVGYQNDYFNESSPLFADIDSFSDQTLNNTLTLLQDLKDVTIFTTPLIYSESYSEISESTSILKKIKDTNSFQKGSEGSKTISEFDKFKDKMIEVPSQIGINAFYGTNLDQFLKIKKIENVVIAGAFCALAIDSTAISARLREYNVTIISDAVSGRTKFEVLFYIKNIFPIYANLITSNELLKELQN